jgi:hypothetical protein
MDIKPTPKADDIKRAAEILRRDPSKRLNVPRDDDGQDETETGRVGEPDQRTRDKPKAQ